jgi:hypothetical protein
VAGGQDQAALFEWRHAGAGAALAGLGAGPHFYEHQGALGRAHDEVDLTPSAMRPAGDPIIALHQRQTLGLQVPAGAVFGL